MQRLALLLALTVILTGCGAKDTDSDRTDTQAAPAYAADETVYIKAAENLSAAFTRELRTELVTAINKKGVVGALDVCAVVAPQVATAHSVDGWRVRRVSDKFRNPVNRADTTQQRILQELAASAEDTPNLVHWSEPDSAGIVTFAYYQPIYVASLCLKCHGDMQTLAPGVLDGLRRHYPTDRAIGYRDKELRGMFVVEAAWPTGLGRAKQLASGTLPTAVSATPPAPPSTETTVTDDTVMTDTVPPLVEEDTVGQG
jgi:hypothetical protein